MDKSMMTPSERNAKAVLELVDMYSAMFFLRQSLMDIADSHGGAEKSEQLNGIAHVMNLLLRQNQEITALVEPMAAQCRGDDE